MKKIQRSLGFLLLATVFGCFPTFCKAQHITVNEQIVSKNNFDTLEKFDDRLNNFIADSMQDFPNWITMNDLDPTPPHPTIFNFSISISLFTLNGTLRAIERIGLSTMNYFIRPSDTSFMGGTIGFQYFPSEPMVMKGSCNLSGVVVGRHPIASNGEWWISFQSLQIFFREEFELERENQFIKLKRNSMAKRGVEFSFSTANGHFEDLITPDTAPFEEDILRTIADYFPLRTFGVWGANVYLYYDYFFDFLQERFQEVPIAEIIYWPDPVATSTTTVSTTSTAKNTSTSASTTNTFPSTSATESANATETTELATTIFYTTSDYSETSTTIETSPSTPSPPEKPPRNFTKCTLAEELYYLFHDKENWSYDKLFSWVCLAEKTTLFNVSHRTGPDKEGIATYGMFNISNRWCSDGWDPSAPCGVDCDDILNPDLIAAMSCAEKIHFDVGFQEWPEYETHCSDPKGDELNDCLETPVFVPSNDNKNSYIFHVGETDANIKCWVRGYPPPTIEWDADSVKHISSTSGRVEIHKSNIKDSEGAWTVQSEIVFSKVESVDKRTYHCNATNKAGRTSSTESHQVVVMSEGGNASMEDKLVMSGAFVGVLLFLIAPIAFLAYRMRNQKKNLDELYKRFKHGVSDCSSTIVNKYDHILGVPFPQDFLCDPAQLTVDENVILGNGAFGIVFQGIFNGIIPAAVKTTTRKGVIKELTNLLMEAKILAKLGPHQNIVTLLGVDISRLEGGYAYVALELCANGCLKGMLDEQRKNLHNFGSSTYRTRELPGYLITSITTAELTSQQLRGFVLDVCSGMEFLASNNVVHGDLAARNVLIDYKFVAKITDFGLSHQLFDEEEYARADKDTMLPWRWLPVECLRELKYSEASDVWALGVFMWEVFTYGEIPYGEGVSFNQSFLTSLEQGFRLRKPAYCEDNLYALMKSCWKLEASTRPTFSSIMVHLQNPDAVM